MSIQTLTLLAVTAATLTAGAGAGVAEALPGSGATGISATLDACHQAADQASRYATFGAQMTAVAGTDQMSIRLELDKRTPADPVFRALSGVPGFDVWKSSAAGVGIFGYSQEVSSLPAPASFRVTVTYRWTGGHHRVIKRTRRTTPACMVTPAPAALVVGTLSRAGSPD